MKIPVDDEELKMRAREPAKFLKKYGELADTNDIAKKGKLTHAIHQAFI